MYRFLGMMPATEIKISKRYKDNSNLTITIGAGDNGWTIIFADYSSKLEDKITTAEENFKSAYKIATNLLGDLKEIV